MLSLAGGLESAPTCPRHKELGSKRRDQRCEILHHFQLHANSDGPTFFAMWYTSTRDTCLTYQSSSNVLHRLQHFPTAVPTMPASFCQQEFPVIGKSISSFLPLLR